MHTENLAKIPDSDLQFLRKKDKFTLNDIIVKLEQKYLYIGKLHRGISGSLIVKNSNNKNKNLV